MNTTLWTFEEKKTLIKESLPITTMTKQYIVD